MSTAQQREARIHLVLKPGRYPWRLRVVKATNKAPRSTPEGSVVVAVDVVMDGSLFEPVEPTGQLVIEDNRISAVRGLRAIADA